VHDNFLWNSYVATRRARSISYGLKPFYAAEEEVVSGLLLAAIAFGLVCGFITYEWLRGRI
jgi:hypothetical protein